MELLLKLEYKDFDLLVSCNSYRKIYEKAVRCMRLTLDSEALLSYYVWDDEAILTCCGEIITKGNLSKSVFFENTDYQYWIQFKIPVLDACIDTPLKALQECFSFNKDARVLYGHINYGNDIGRTELKISYKISETSSRLFVFGYDVLAVKLDYHKDLKIIIDDIEKEYRMLSIDFFRRTYHSFTEKRTGETPDIIWWNVFNEVHQEFIQSVKSIVDHPRNHLVQEEVYLLADKLKRLSPVQEMQLVEFRTDKKRLYRTRVLCTDINTFENRFLKYAVRLVQQKFSLLSNKIRENYPMISGKKYLETLTTTENELKRLVYHPFFRRVGDFKGMNQESLVLKQEISYAQLYRNWLLLTCSYELEDGLRSLELKDIAALYEIWCFIKVKDLLQELLGKGVCVDNQSRVELSKHFTYCLANGQNSRIVFAKKDKEGNDIELAEIMYNPTEDININSRVTGIDKTYSYTVPQKPDIVLQLIRRDVETNFKLTYLFDAKYRVGSTDVNGVDAPPDDAINQMHRYRDALYYDPKQEGLPIKKEILGGYILFPGNGEDEQIENANFYKSIGKVNIGAFPLRPNNFASEHLLADFLKMLIWNQPTVQILQNVIPHKGTSLSIEKTGNVLAVTIFEKGNRAYFERFMNREAVINYYFGKIMPFNSLSKLNFQKYDYFVPVIKGQIRDIYQIDFCNVEYRKNLPNQGNKQIDNDDVRIVMRLVKPSYLIGAKCFEPLEASLFPPRRWGFREFSSVKELLGCLKKK